MNSVERVRSALKAAGHADTITNFPDSTRTAADAAAAIGCTVAQIAKCVVFRMQDAPVLIIASGINRIDPAKIGRVLGVTVNRADPAWIRDTTGFAIGGVAPIGHLTAPIVLIDRDLLALDPVWAAAGSPTHAFCTTTAALIDMSNGRAVDVKKEPEH